MARPKAPTGSVATVSGNQRPKAGNPTAFAASAAVHRQNVRANPKTDRQPIAKPWQIEAYRHVNICGEARYAATLFAAMAGRAEIGISEPNTLARKAAWVESGPEVDALAELAPTVRDRTKLVRDYMLHRVIAGECYLIGRDRVDTDGDPGNPLPVWEVVAVTELRKTGDTWSVRHEGGNYVDLAEDDPIIRLWTPDPSNRMEAWSPFRSLLPTLREIEWLTGHIFTQIKSRLMSAGVWFLPENLTFPSPPPDAIEGGEETLATLNEPELFALSLAASGMQELDDFEVSFPTVVMADPAALAAIDQNKLIKFWSEIDDKAMTLRSDNVRRFALGMDLPPEQVLGSSGVAVSGSAGSAGSVNHWGVWANEEQTISAHIEPALDDLVNALTVAFLRVAVDNTDKVVGYDTASLRLRQDRSKEAMEWYDRGALKLSVALRENGFDPQTDMMDEDEFKRWLLTRIAGGSATPEQVNESLRLLGVVLNVPVGSGATSGGEADAPAPGQPGRNLPPSLKDHPYEGPPREDHDHNEAPFSAFHAAAEALTLRALEKAGARLLTAGVRGKNRDTFTPRHLAHIGKGVEPPAEWDFDHLDLVYGDLTAAQRAETKRQLSAFCSDLYRTGSPYTREALIKAVGGQ